MDAEEDANNIEHPTTEILHRSTQLRIEVMQVYYKFEFSVLEMCLLSRWAAYDALVFPRANSLASIHSPMFSGTLRSAPGLNVNFI